MKTALEFFDELEKKMAEAFILAWLGERPPYEDYPPSKQDLADKGDD